MMKKIKNNKGVTLVSLAIAVAIIMILTNVIVYNAIDGLRANKLANLQTDIENLRDKVSNYYAQNGAIPADTSIEYTNIGNLSSVIGATDTGKFYVIDLAAMENVTLNYGRDYEKIRNKEVTTQSEINNLTDLYIINFDSHNVFYVAGIEVDGEMYYTDYTEDDKDTVPVTIHEVSEEPSQGEEQPPTDKEPISTGRSYVGCYADIDDNGTVDGIIYADLAMGGEGIWTDNNGYYVIPKEEGLREYYISKEEHTEPKFGLKRGAVISLIDKEDTRTERFYVMNIEDFSQSTYYWYYRANGLKNYIASTENDFGEGENNTKTMLKEWNDGTYGTKDSNDMWGAIQEEIEKGWYVPSKSEWSAFAAQLGIYPSIYGDYGLRDYYWTSSQESRNYVYVGVFGNGAIGSDGVNGAYYVRLGTNF